MVHYSTWYGSLLQILYLVEFRFPINEEVMKVILHLGRIFFGCKIPFLPKEVLRATIFLLKYEHIKIMQINISLKVFHYTPVWQISIAAIASSTCFLQSGILSICDQAVGTSLGLSELYSEDCKHFTSTAVTLFGDTSLYLCVLPIFSLGSDLFFTIFDFSIFIVTFCHSISYFHSLCKFQINPLETVPFSRIWMFWISFDMKTVRKWHNGR